MHLCCSAHDLDRQLDRKAQKWNKESLVLMVVAQAKVLLGSLSWLLEKMLQGFFQTIRLKIKLTLKLKHSITKTSHLLNLW